ncbi:hypothetical protein DVB69_00280 [Sporosarcina sp. BI001-red]|uniref:hypothetical protein n=1 Tax=Sporosarcina sp. BI001-red TaxID=2282866 RepID=UPI000E264D5A|nr:hypothetical protein [Sporosarcina sp. BI001-red]REB11617.1 hypothetical protein DVB69_00280 [Sporosarcina sp. BI001-red]
MKLTYAMVPLILGGLLLGGCQSSEPKETEEKPSSEESVDKSVEKTDIDETDDSIDSAIYEEQVTKDGGLGDTLPVLENIMGSDGEHDWNARIDEVIAFHEKGEGYVHPILESNYDRFSVQADDKMVIFGTNVHFNGDEPLPNKDEVLAHAKNHIPTDSKMTGEVKMENGLPIFEFTSEIFKQRFPSEEGHFHIRAVSSEDESEFTSYAVLPGEFKE